MAYLAFISVCCLADLSIDFIKTLTQGALGVMCSWDYDYLARLRFHFRLVDAAK